MAEALTRLTDQLLDDPDPKIRRQAAKKLGDLKNTEAIAPLVQAYTSDPDAGVQKAARDALLIYRALEQKMTSRGLVPRIDAKAEGESAEVQPTRPRGGNPRRTRSLLTIVLVITALANIGLIVLRSVRSLSNQGNAPIDVIISPREILIADYQGKISALKDDYPAFRQKLAVLQSTLLSEVRPPKPAPNERAIFVCDEKPLLPVLAAEPRIMGEADRAVHIDIALVADRVNKAITDYQAVRTRYTDLCGIEDYAKLREAANNLREGESTGVPALIARLDNINNVMLSEATSLLARAVESPYATSTLPPSATPTITLTPTEPPPATATPITANTQPAQATATMPSAAAATNAPTPIPVEPTATPTATLTATPVPIPDLVKLGLTSLSRLEYRLRWTYEGTFENTESNGALEINVKHQTNPSTGYYQIRLTDTQSRNTRSPFRGLAFFPATMYVTGLNEYTSVSNGIYLLPPTGVCRNFALNSQTGRNLSALIYGPDGILSNVPRESITFVGQQDNRLQFQAKVEEKSDTGTTVSQYDILYAPDLKLVTSIKYTGSVDTRSGNRTTKLTLSGEFTLSQTNDSVDISTVKRPAECRAR